MAHPTSESANTRSADEHSSEKATATAEEIKQQAKARIHAVGDEIDRRLGDLGETARETADEMVQRAKQAVEDQRSAIGREVQAVAGCLRDAAEKLDGDDHDLSADLFRRGAAQVDRLATAIDERTVPELISIAGEQTRKHKWVVFGGTLALGFLAARFLKASNPERALAVPGPGDAAAESQPIGDRG
ncbi:MAG: hypothetical protein R3F65_15675 [bacterium]